MGKRNRVTWKTIRRCSSPALCCRISLRAAGQFKTAWFVFLSTTEFVSFNARWESLGTSWPWWWSADSMWCSVATSWWCTWPYRTSSSVRSCPWRRSPPRRDCLPEVSGSGRTSVSWRNTPTLKPWWLAVWPTSWHQWTGKWILWYSLWWCSAQAFREHDVTKPRAEFYKPAPFQLSSCYSHTLSRSWDSDVSELHLQLQDQASLPSQSLHSLSLVQKFEFCPFYQVRVGASSFFKIVFQFPPQRIKLLNRETHVQARDWRWRVSQLEFDWRQWHRPWMPDFLRMRKSVDTGEVLRISCVCRLILVASPLGYKRLMTRRRQHLLFLLSWLFFGLICGTTPFIFFRRDFSRSDDCISANVLQAKAYYVMPVGQFALATFVLVVNYIAITVIMTKRQKERRLLNMASNVSGRDSCQTHCLTKVTVITLGIFLVLITPGVVVSCVAFLIHKQDTLVTILLDVSHLIYFMNNVVNPFVYGFTMRKFREGYKRIFCARLPGRTNSTSVAVVGLSWNAPFFCNFLGDYVLLLPHSLCSVTGADLTCKGATGTLVVSLPTFNPLKFQNCTKKKNRRKRYQTSLEHRNPSSAWKLQLSQVPKGVYDERRIATTHFLCSPPDWGSFRGQKHIEHLQHIFVPSPMTGQLRSTTKIFLCSLLVSVLIIGAVEMQTTPCCWSDRVMYLSPFHTVNSVGDGTGSNPNSLWTIKTVVNLSWARFCFWNDWHFRCWCPCEENLSHLLTRKTDGKAASKALCTKDGWTKLHSDVPDCVALYLNKYVRAYVMQLNGSFQSHAKRGTHGILSHFCAALRHNRRALGYCVSLVDEELGGGWGLDSSSQRFLLSLSYEIVGQVCQWWPEKVRLFEEQSRLVPFVAWSSTPDPSWQLKLCFCSGYVENSV